MKRRDVFIDPFAQQDLIHIYNVIAELGGPAPGAAFVEQIIAHCMKFDLASERGNRRDDIRPGLRITGYRRRVTIAFSVTETRVEILRVFYGGVDWEPLLA